VEEFDLLVVGGGINGTGIARDAAGRSLSVLLVEKDDLAAHTSSASSKLIHGGLRYLEQLDFKLVRESLVERERLLRAAPHLVRPLEFIIPIARGGRSPWLLRAGLFLYDHLARRTVLPGSRAILQEGDGLRPEIDRGFAYWDCRVQDSRLVVANAIDAAERGATILPRTELLGARRESQLWLAQLRDHEGERAVAARALVNAAGPWAGQLFERIAGVALRHAVRLVKGSHVVLPRLHSADRAVLMQAPDGRVVFAMPFEKEFTLVGTTDVEWSGDPGAPAVSDDEQRYLLETVGRYFSTVVSSDDVVWSYSGVRALCDDGTSNPSRASRDYILELDTAGAPLLSVIGGKITTYRRLAEQALNRLSSHLPQSRGAWTADAMLPGGAIPQLDIESYGLDIAAEFPKLPVKLVTRLVQTYGTRTERLLQGVQWIDDLGEHFGENLYAKEVDYLVAHEWARSPEDVLFRRTKLGLHLPGLTDRLAAYMIKSGN